MDLLGRRGKETVTAAIFLIPCPWGPKFVDVTGMVAVYMLKSYPENQLCDIVYGDGIVLLLRCSDLLEIWRVKKGKVPKSYFQFWLYFG